MVKPVLCLKDIAIGLLGSPVIDFTITPVNPIHSQTETYDMFQFVSVWDIFMRNSFCSKLEK
ncbi:hypothetical protein JCM11017A_21930 [Bacteroides fragilis]